MQPDNNATLRRTVLCGPIFSFPLLRFPLYLPLAILFSPKRFIRILNLSNEIRVIVGLKVDLETSERLINYTPTTIIIRFRFPTEFSILPSSPYLRPVDTLIRSSHCRKTLPSPTNVILCVNTFPLYVFDVKTSSEYT